jgi:hypothetical protein
LEAESSLEPGEMSPRAVAPEKREGMAAMRALANLSAQNAIGQHARRQLSLAARTKLVIAIAGALAAGLQLWMGLLPGAAQITRVAGAACLVVAMYWGIQYIALAGSLMLNKFGRNQNNQNRTQPRKEQAVDAVVVSPPEERPAS